VAITTPITKGDIRFGAKKQHPLIASILGVGIVYCKHAGVPMPRKKPALQTHYCHSDGEPCRIQRNKDGDLTGDVYRSGQGIVPIDSTDIYDNGFPISRARHDELVAEMNEVPEVSKPPMRK
jgi:hypothetical protein